MYIVIAILCFGFLIFIHELGHFLVARAFGVRVNEFALGMGPQLLKKQGKETLYSLRLFPIGGFCAMEGEDSESDDPRSFSAQAAWKRALILCAGAAMNFLTGFLIVFIIYLVTSGGYSSPVISGFYSDCPYQDTLQVGDRIVAVDNEPIYFASNFSTYAGMDTDGLLDVTILRNGEKITLKDYPLVPVEYTLSDGSTVTKYGIYFSADEPTLGNTIKYSWYSCLDFVRLVRNGLVQLFTGKAAIKQMSGVVGMVDAINSTGQSAASVAEGLENVFYLIAFIAVNLAVMNMLPLPALDGGHIVTLLISALIKAVIHRKPDPRIERYIHAGGLVLLMGLMVVVMFNDITRIVIG